MFAELELGVGESMSKDENLGTRPDRDPTHCCFQTQRWTAWVPHIVFSFRSADRFQYAARSALRNGKGLACETSVAIVMSVIEYLGVIESKKEEEAVAAPTPADKWCVTDKVKEVKTYSFQWTVNNFTERCSDCTDLLSSAFSVCGHQWCLKLDLSKGSKERVYHREAPRHFRSEHETTRHSREYTYSPRSTTRQVARDFQFASPSLVISSTVSSTTGTRPSTISLVLKLVKPSPTAFIVKVSYAFAILGTECQKVYRKEDKKVQNFQAGTEWGIGDFIEYDYLFKEASKLLPQDKLTIHCEVTEIVGNGAPVHITGKYVQVRECSLASDLGSLLEEGLLSDVTLVNVKSKKKFEAHKAILSIRSPVFRQMFQHEMKEKATNRVEIEDTEDKVLNEMLTFIYTGKAPSIVSMTGTQGLQDLFCIADKYEVCRLKEICAEAMCKNLSSSSVVSTLLLADKHSSYALREACIEFIAGHASQVMATQEWKDLKVCPDYFKMVTEIYERILKQTVPGFKDSEV